MKQLEDRARIKIFHRPTGRYLYGTLATLRGTFAESEFCQDKYRTYEHFVEEQFRRGQPAEVWGNQDPSVIISSPVIREKLAQKRAECLEIVDGETVIVDGEQWTVRITGNFSDFVHFFRKEFEKTAA